MNTNDREIVSAIRARLADRLGNDRYEVWFGASTQLSVRGENLIVTTSNQFFQDWLRTHFRKDLEAASLEACGTPLGLEFRIAAPPAAPVVDSRESNETQPNSTQASSPSVEAKPLPPSISAPSMSLNGNGAATHRPGRRQLSSLEEFVLGKSNCLAHKTSEITAEHPGTYSPLLIYGPTGTGKTHLLEGILAGFRKTRPRAATVYMSAEQFTSCFLEALHGSGLPNFRRKHRGLELLIIDDIQFFANKRATLVELLHTIDTLLRAGKQVVFASDRSPAALKSLGSELASRFSGGMACRIESPEYATRLGIVRRMAQRLEVNVPEEVAAFVASHFTTQSRELAGALNRLQAMCVVHRRPITLAMAEESLAELIDHQGQVIKLADIEKAVCDVFGLNPESLQSTRKAKMVSHPRMLAMWLARKHTRAALSEIGSYFGRRSHSTVISAQKKIDTWIAKDSSQPLADHTLSLEESIRRVEENLRAG